MLIVLVILLAMLVGAPVVSAEVAPGPHLASIELIERKGYAPNLDPEPSVALAVIDPSTGREKLYLRGKIDERKRVVPAPFGTPSWAADGGLIAFTGFDGNALKDRIYVVAPDGTNLRPLPRTQNGSDPVLSPDGHLLAFTRSRYRSHINKNFFKDFKGEPVRVYSSKTTWIVDLAGGKPRRLTPWRNGLYNTPTSFSPDGTGLLLTKEDDRLDGVRVMRMSLADGATNEVLKGAVEAKYSPDGSRIAFVGYLHRDIVKAEENHDYLASELYVAAANGTGVRRLSRSKGVLESSPSWDPSGQRLAYVQLKGDTSFLAGLSNLFPTGNALMQVNADGTCRKKIASRPSTAFYGVAWQPGVGREAGPIIC
ncbi:MAG: TolB protein [Solirubrobacterales bacterium]|nr:TolB protein [Solirubrobacterales bacterium]